MRSLTPSLTLTRPRVLLTRGSGKQISYAALMRNFLTLRNFICKGIASWNLFPSTCLVFAFNSMSCISDSFAMVSFLVASQCFSIMRGLTPCLVNKQFNHPSLRDPAFCLRRAAIWHNSHKHHWRRSRTHSCELLCKNHVWSFNLSCTYSSTNFDQVMVAISRKKHSIYSSFFGSNVLLSGHVLRIQFAVVSWLRFPSVVDGGTPSWFAHQKS